MGCSDLVLVQLLCGKVEDYVPPKPPEDPKDRPYVVYHNEWWISWWDRLIIGVIIMSLFIVPFRIGFDLGGDIEAYYWWMVPDISMDLTFVADIVLSFFKTYEDTGETITDRFLIARRYIRGSFGMDVISTFPADYIYLAVTKNATPLTRINRLLRLRRLLDFLLTWELNSTMKPSVTGIVKIIFIIFFISHIVACVFHGVTILEQSGPAFTSTRDPVLHERPTYIRYLRSFFWAMLTLTGYNASNPQVFSEIILCCVLTIFSVFLFGTIIGSFGNLLTTLDSSMVFFRQKQDIVLDYMAYKKIPYHLQRDVRKYYNYMWESGKALQQNEAVDRLPLMLRQKMNFYMNFHSIRKVYLFAGVEDDLDFMGEIVRSLRPRIGLPNAYIVKKGEYGTEMYFISRGELNVINDEGKVVATLSDGMFFGEIALLYKTKRNASIVARTFCDMYVLTRDEFRKVMRKYPIQSKGIKDVAKKRCTAIVQTAVSTPQKSPDSSVENITELNAVNLSPANHGSLESERPHSSLRGITKKLIADETSITEHSRRGSAWNESTYDRSVNSNRPQSPRDGVFESVKSGNFLSNQQSRGQTLPPLPYKPHEKLTADNDASSTLTNVGIDPKSPNRLSSDSIDMKDDNIESHPSVPVSE